MGKSSYRTTKLTLWLSSAMAWMVILILAVGAARAGQAVEFGTIAVPSMVMIILGVLGIHRGFGSVDMHLMTRAAKPDPACAEPCTGGQP
ncbi:hypothetical protein H4S14_003385 [Agrobacterium vitis]|nr:hypothetical protein [Agrobacterium vitis]MBE1439620.1 hypothetical protein [Agrobacterium vitis]